ncbi:MAG: ATP-binding protein [Chloroflexota bacterium]
MSPERRPFFRGAPIPFSRLTAIALVFAAILPAAALGLVVSGQVQRALDEDAIVRTERAVAAANLHLQQAQADLDGLVASYATWPVFGRMVAGGELGNVHDDVVAFLVAQGSVAAGRVDAGSGVVAAGDDAVTAKLAGSPTTAAGVPAVIDVDESVYLVSSQPVADPERPGQTVGQITMARRLDAVFTAGLATLTGYAVTIAGPDGLADVTTDPDTAAAAIAATASGTGVARDGDLVATRSHIAGSQGGADIVLSSRVSALQTTAGGLPLLILGLLLVTAVLALGLAWLLARILRRRLAVVHEGLVAIADGRVPPARAPQRGDDIARVADGLDRLVSQLDHRESVLRRSLAAAAAVPIHLSTAEAGQALAKASVEIFGLAWARIIEPDGSVLATAGDPAGEPHGLVVEAQTGLGIDDRRLEAGVRAGAAWSDGDQASLEVMALLAGGVITESLEYGAAANRAERLERLNRLQREFLRGVSHNLRTPLATIELAASDLLEDDDAYVRGRAEAIRVQERRLARLVGEVLLLSRMESGTLELEGEPVSLGALTRRVASELGVAARVELSEQAGGAVAIADEAATEQIVWVLLDNADRYAPDGPIRVEILDGGADAGEPTIVLAVQDEGPGVAPGDERRIFRRFARGAASEGTEGTGVGLSVARGLARALGGDVAYRRVERGARFELTLPSSGRPDEDAELGAPAARGA